MQVEIRAGNLYRGEEWIGRQGVARDITELKQLQAEVIFNTHTDGENFVEENGGVAFVQLARYFASLPPEQRLKRTLVFAAWPGHMAPDLPQTQGWIDEHPDLVKRAAAALTIEHLGCSEWSDTIDAGYRSTENPEILGIWTTQGKMFELTRDTILKHDIPRAALLRPPVSSESALPTNQAAGVPQIGAIAGPEYLITVSGNGEIDKLDETLAANQIAWLADLATQIDGVAAADLRQGDSTLGTPAPVSGPLPGAKNSSHVERCAPGGDVFALVLPGTNASAVVGPQVLTARHYGRRHSLHGIRVDLNVNRGTLNEVTVELHHKGHLVAHSRVRGVNTGRRRVTLRRRHGGKFALGQYTLVVRPAGTTALRRVVPVGGSR